MSFQEIFDYVREKRTEGIRPYLVRSSQLSVDKSEKTSQENRNGSESRQASNEERILNGEASVFDSGTTIQTPFGEFEEVVRQGAFSKTIQENDVRALWNHETSFPLGRQSAETLRLEETSSGLQIENELPDSPIGENAFVTVKRGDVQGMSIGFDVIKEEWTEPDERENADIPLREIFEIRLHEVSPVTFPAFPETSVDTGEELSLRDQLRVIKEKRNLDLPKVINVIYRNTEEKLTKEEKSLLSKEVEKIQQRFDTNPSAKNELERKKQRLSIYERYAS